MSRFSTAHWGPVLSLPLVPASAANLPDGKVLLWSADDRFWFAATGQVYTLTLDPLTGAISEQFESNTGQNMFCPGTTNLADGRILVSGGSNAAHTSIYDPATSSWSASGQMSIPRAYQANTLLRDGTVFTLGGSWSGGVGDKHGELWNEATGWRQLPGVRVDSFMTNDPTGAYRADNHMWLIPTGNGRVLHAGPSANMHWIDPAGNGATEPAGPRGDDVDSMSGNTVMVDTGKVLKLGGSVNYDGVPASRSAYSINLLSGLRVRKLAPMAYARAFHNSVVLPNGQVIVVGGQSFPAPFSDNNSVLVPELWDPATETFSPLPPMHVPRNYHSVAVLMSDARVLSAGGGLCGMGCAGNHPDAQILTPHYLFNDDGSLATRPAITAAPPAATYGTTMLVETDSPVTSFALVRLGSTTHTVNNDQRRLSLRYVMEGENRYAVSVPTNPGWALPGAYMLFAMNAQGVPSIAKTVIVQAGGAPTLAPVADRSGNTGTPVALALAASGATQFAAEGLPPGMAIQAQTGAITGTPHTPGLYAVTVSAGNADGTVSTDFLWQVNLAGAVRYVRLEQLSEVNGNAWGSMAELNLLDGAGNPLHRAGWTVSADSEEFVGEDGAARNAIDGDHATKWHTSWAPTALPPHHFTVDMGQTARLSGLRYLPRQDGTEGPNGHNGNNGTIAQFRIYVSADGLQWGTPVAAGDMRQINPDHLAEKTVPFFAGRPPENVAPVLRAPGDQGHHLGEQIMLDLIATDDQTEPLSFSAQGLPPGLDLLEGGASISGTATVAGLYNVTVVVTDRENVSRQAQFVWRIRGAPPPEPTVAAPIITAGTTAAFTAVVPGTVEGLSYAWDYGDGSPVTAFTASPAASHVYTTPGLYDVVLQVRTADGQIGVHRFTQAVAGVLVGGARPAATSAIVWEPASASYGARIWVVNPDHDTVSVFDAATNVRLSEIAAGKNPRSLTLLGTARQVWVANQGGASVSVIDATSRTVLRTLAMPAHSQPWGVLAAPAGDRVYVSLQALGRVLQLDAAGNALALLSVGDWPRHLALTADASQLLVSRFISAPLPGEGTVSVQTTRAGSPVGGEVLVLGTRPLALRTRIVLRHSDKADSTVQGRGIPNYLGAAVIAPDGRSAWVPSKQDNLRRGLKRDGLDLDFQNTVRAISSRIVMDTLAEDHAARIDHDNASLASAGVFHPSGAYLFTALETSRQVAVIDPITARELLRIDTDLAPQGLAVSGDGRRLYVSNFMGRSVGVYDLAPLVDRGLMDLPLAATMASVATERLPAQVLRGKQLFYDARDPRLARDAYMSCASCHQDGGHDGRTWDMTGRGEGLRNTIALQGRAGGQGLLHWSGNFDEVQDFEAQIRTLAGGTGLMANDDYNAGTRSQPLGDAKAGLSADLDALAAYVRSLDSFVPSPLRQAGDVLTLQAVAGRGVFAAKCASCHGTAAFTRSADGLLRNVGTLKPSSGTRLGAPLTGIDIPTLRDAWATAPYLHDGSALTLEDAVRAHTTLPVLSSSDLANVTAFVRQIGGAEPAVDVVPNGRYVRFEALSEVNGNAWASMAEFDLLSSAGQPLSRTGWRIVGSSSQETWSLNGAAENVLDGRVGTLWHTAYSSSAPRHPHWIVIDTRATQAIAGFRYQPRSNGTAGTVARWRMYVSDSTGSWGTPVGEGDLMTLGPATSAKQVMFGP